MTDINTTKNTTAPPPLLASSLLTDEHLDRILAGVVTSARETRTATAHATATKCLNTGFHGVDASALAGGGLENGRVVEIAGDEAGGVAEIYKALLVSFLVQYSKEQTCLAAVVDTTGNFDVVGLYGALVARLKKDKEVEKSEVEKMAAEMLERVKIMRVFDFEGVREAVGEIEAGILGAKEEEKKKKKRTYVADSEDEDDDEMLFDETKTPLKPTRETDTRSTVKFVLIDHLTQVLSPLLRNDVVQGTSQSTTLLSTLSRLTHTHTLYTLLVTPTTTTTTTQPRPASPPRPDQEKDVPPSPSIFSSNNATGLPALSALMGLYTDMRLVVSRVPRRRADARLYYADEGGAALGIKRKRGECVGVLEVVGDRWGERTGGWGVF